MRNWFRVDFLCGLAHGGRHGEALDVRRKRTVAESWCAERRRHDEHAEHVRGRARSQALLSLMTDDDAGVGLDAGDRDHEARARIILRMLIVTKSAPIRGIRDSARCQMTPATT